MAQILHRRGGEDRPVAAPISQSDLLGNAAGRPDSVLRRNALGLVCLALFLAIWFGQSLSGWHVYNDDAQAHSQELLSYPGYLLSPHFLEATFENWESEFLQMFSFVLLAAWFVQRGSSESKPEDGSDVDDDPRGHEHDPDAPWPVRRGGFALKIYENSLLLAFLVLFFASWAGHAFAGAAEFSQEQTAHGETAVSVWQFVTTSQFWFESLQNWQSEFLAVFSIVVLTIFLRQRHSPESKPVHAPNHRTGS